MKKNILFILAAFLIAFSAFSQNVGIGITNPVDKFHMKGTMRLDPPGAFGGSILKMYSATNIDNSFIHYYNQFSATTPSATIGYSAGNDYLLLSCGLGDIFIKSEGIGIETTSPNAKLHVNGNVMIGSGTPTSGYALSVNGKVISEEVRVEADVWPDYVFESNYLLTPLNALEKFIIANKHLPNIPSAADVKKDGISLGDMNKRLLEKIEELTLHLIEQEKRMNKLQQQLNEIQELKNK